MTQFDSIILCFLNISIVILLQSANELYGISTTLYIGVTYCYYYIRYTGVIAIDFLSQHPSPNHGLWEAKRVST